MTAEPDHRAAEEPAAARVRAAEYVRMSTEHQQYSTENQADIIRAYAAARGIDIVKTYADEGRSGLRLDGRAALKALISDVEGGRADYRMILVYDVSRWGRFQDADESAYYEYICKRVGIAVHYCAEQFENDGSPVSTIVKGVKRAMAGEYSRELSSKVFIGYKPRRDFEFIEINRALRRMHPEIVNGVIAALRTAGSTVERSETDLIMVNGEFTASIVISRCQQTQAGAYRWRLRFDTGLVPDVSIVVRMAANNQDPLDYYLFPSIDLRRDKLRLAEENGLALDAYRFDDLEAFYDFVSPVQLREAA